jgi:hypothetical protein
MCIAILNNGKMLPKQKMLNCWTNNDDGAGILYIQDGLLVVEKFSNADYINTTNNFNKFFSRYQEIKKSISGDSPMLLHFRIATHGFTDEYLHPFMVSDSLGLIHNGIIQGFGSKDMSDTAQFTQLLSTIPMSTCDVLDVAFIMESIYAFIGTHNKLIFLDSSGDFRIFNEKQGAWIGDNWFSNDSHTDITVRYYGSTAVYAGANAYKVDYDYDGIDDWNASFLGKAYASEIAAPTKGKYACYMCDNEVHVNYDAECVDCGVYLEDAVDEIVSLYDSQTKLNEDV